MPDVIDVLYWFVGPGNSVLAALVLGIFGLIALRIWKSIAPRLQESRLSSELQSAEETIQDLETVNRQLNSDLEENATEAAELNETILNLMNKIEELQEEFRHVKRSEEAYAQNVELLKSSIEETILGSQPPGGMASPQLQTAARMLAERLLRETERSLHTKLTPQNFATSKKRLESVFDLAEKQELAFSEERRTQSLEDLKSAFEEEVRKELARQEQARIRAQIREEQQLEAERVRELKRLEAQQRAIQEALDRELARTQNEHSQEVEALRAQLAEAEARTERAVSQAQLTRAGHIYVISNIGSFGEDVFKVGMTRRLEPLDRVRELGDASVPFPFDVHMMISCDDAPTLENTLHRELSKMRLNRVNPRKEFFRVELSVLAQLVEQHHGKIEYLAEPEAMEYRNSMEMTDEEEAYVNSVVEPLVGAEAE